MRHHPRLSSPVTILSLLATVALSPGELPAQDEGPLDPCGAIRTWNLLGAYDNPGGETPGEDAIRADYMTDGTVTELDFVWRPGATIHTDYSQAASSRIEGGATGRNPGGVPTVFEYREKSGRVDFQSAAAFGEDLDNFMAYAQVYVFAERRTEAFLGISSDDSVQVILQNEKEEVWIHNIARGSFGPCEPLFPHDEVPVTLKPGYHSLMVKVFEGRGNWDFTLRIQDEFLDPVTGLTISLEPPGPAPRDDFVRGDADGDGAVNISDGVFLLNFLFVSPERRPGCDDAADADDSGALNLTDVIFILNFLFRGGSRPPAPFPDCGSDGTSDSLECAARSAGCG